MALGRLLGAVLGGSLLLALSCASTAGVKCSINGRPVSCDDEPRAAPPSGTWSGAPAPATNQGVVAYNNGLALMKQSRFAEAEQQFRFAAGQLPGDPDPHRMIGLALQRQAKNTHSNDERNVEATIALVEQAIAAYATAIRLGDRGDAANNKAELENWLRATRQELADYRARMRADEQRRAADARRQLAEAKSLADARERIDRLASTVSPSMPTVDARAAQPRQGLAVMTVDPVSDPMVVDLSHATRSSVNLQAAGQLPRTGREWHAAMQAPELRRTVVDKRAFYNALLMAQRRGALGEGVFDQWLVDMWLKNPPDLTVEERRRLMAFKDWLSRAERAEIDAFLAEMDREMATSAPRR